MSRINFARIDETLIIVPCGQTKVIGSGFTPQIREWSENNTNSCQTGGSITTARCSLEKKEGGVLRSITRKYYFSISSVVTQRNASMRQTTASSCHSTTQIKYTTAAILTLKQGNAKQTVEWYPNFVEADAIVKLMVSTCEK